MACIINQFSTVPMGKFRHGSGFDTRQFSQENCARFAEAIYKQCGVYKHIVGFIDGTMQKVCRPTEDDEQKLVYNGWKHIHCIKHQAIATPDGITSSLVGPFIGSTHDAKMFDDSRTLDRLILHLDQLSTEENDIGYAIYGDLAYTASEHVFRPYREYELRRHLNGKYVIKKMSKVRVQVEMEFGKMFQFFKFCKSDYAMKIRGNTKPFQVYVLCTIFKNFHTCFNGSAATAIFGLTPPIIE
ncbi:hypothetical protein PHYBLDRAFT_63722 [Phycomyces blakesleeanus NRRL 1555(-)]|uniref:DDE Tnp4 domain-containing protein n=1 Tax=Phycomyces blakesleeanus (strain ATCC 8743b / DSM 1359 / FGSC 10004 / NBRC 33097 / NRRL 1555) TaxID=763407 RepID=A0A162ZJT0_PHYB8|nr:hypothetical protein PHYBLDRAFT_63722 [Phycomyces blakesleeanus NRRL 1555(-)]OAD67281.1 hypothetical protein PHYBLDRAFT_63722 [Phycomyces blakesleeanus NRRL 1555(-)]|eukprot:XP_018285321.1 hypothetical protein PHYBLDRAFT_63722 [Phycomyces blakesleeanus NRRL 1555(-)]